MKDLKRDDLKDAKDKTKVIKDSLNNIMDYIIGKEDKRQALCVIPIRFPLIIWKPPILYQRIKRSDHVNGSTRVWASPGANHEGDAAREYILEKSWTEYKSAMEKVSISPFKNYRR